MNRVFFMMVMPLIMFAKVHYAKLEPYESVVLKSAVSGVVQYVDLIDEGSMVDGKMVIHIDDKLDKINLKDSKKDIELLNNMLNINEDIAKALKGSMQRQESYYSRISKLSTASKTQKDSAYSNFTSVKTQYLTTKEKIISLKKQIVDMQYKVEKLKDSIEKKSIILNNKYLYKLMVRVGDFVAPGVALAKIKDISRGKLVLFLDADELNNIDKKIVYLDGKKSPYKVDKVWRVTDEKFISSYRTKIYINAPKEQFSKLIKVEIK